MPTEQIVTVTEGDPAATTSTTPDPAQHLGDPGKRALTAERDRADAAEREAKQLRDEITKRDQAAEAARQKEAAEQGKWQELATERETALTAAQQDRDSAVTERDALRTYFDAEYTTAIKDLPDVITAFKPADDASFTVKSEWLAKAKEQAAKVAGSAKTPGNGPNPPVSDGKFDLDAAVAQGQASGKYNF
jgi:hypothetical protein